MKKKSLPKTPDPETDNPVLYGTKPRDFEHDEQEFHFPDQEEENDPQKLTGAALPGTPNSPGRKGTGK